MEEQQGFINFIRQQYNNDICRIIKTYMNTNRKRASFTARKLFLTRCRRYGIYPNHIINNVKCLFTNIELNMPFNNKIRNLMENFKRKILNVEIEITFWKIKEFNQQLSAYNNELRNANIDNQFLATFYTNQDRIFNNQLNNHLIIVNRKFDTIIDQQRPVLNIANNNACHNISNINIPTEVKDVVSLGPKFNLPFFDKQDIPAYKILAQAESVIQKIDNEHQSDIARFQICNVFQNYLTKNIHLSMKERYLQHITKETKTFLKDNPNILVVNADKGNISVIMLKSEYEEKIYTLVNDQNTYKLLNKDPTNTLQTKNNKKIAKLFSEGYVDEVTKANLTTYTAVVPKFYGLPKVHKENHPLRPIVSFINSPTYKTSKFLANLLKSATNELKYNIKNSFQLIDFIKDQNIPNGYVLISLDVVSLFTNININLALDTISSRWSMIEPHTTIPKIQLLDLLEFCLNSGYFSVFNKYYKQVNGVAMGSPLSPIIADIVMEVLLDTILSSNRFNILFIKKYVDDLLLCVPVNQIAVILSQFNDNGFGLEFTLETETNNKLPFLDTLLIRKNDGKIDTIWYEKSLSSGRILNFNSFHPLNQLINTAFGFIYRVKKLTTDISVETNQIILNYLTKNKYPKLLINKLINRFDQLNLGPMINTNANNSNMVSVNNQNLMYKSICYVKNLSEQISNILGRFNTNCKITFASTNQIRNIFSKIKDETPKLYHSNIVYLIPCNNCNLKYVGTTKQLLKNRITQHKSDVKPPIRNFQATTLCQHSYESGHNFKFSDTRILEYEKCYKERLFLEMVHIKSNQEILVNKKNDTNDLSRIYSGIIDSISKFPRYARI